MQNAVILSSPMMFMISQGCGLYLSDIPPHDFAGDFALLSEVYHVDLDVKEKLEVI